MNDIFMPQTSKQLEGCIVFGSFVIPFVMLFLWVRYLDNCLSYDLETWWAYWGWRVDHLTFEKKKKVISFLTLSFQHRLCFQHPSERRFLFGSLFQIEKLICDWQFLIWYQKPFVISVPVLCFWIFTTKLILWPKIGLTYAVCSVNWIFFFI